MLVPPTQIALPDGCVTRVYPLPVHGVAIRCRRSRSPAGSKRGVCQTCAWSGATCECAPNVMGTACSVPGNSCQIGTCSDDSRCVELHSPCSDGNVCTVDECHSDGGPQCTYTPIGASQYDDGDPCTDDFCDPVKGFRHENVAADLAQDGPYPWPVCTDFTLSAKPNGVGYGSAGRGRSRPGARNFAFDPS